MTRNTSSACIVCGATRWTPLPDPGSQSMASDWRVVGEPLARSTCDSCGLARRWATVATGASLFASGYRLYAHKPGESRERARQEAYARWIADAAQRTPERVLDVGCGNGSLLIALSTHWPRAELLGCDLSPESLKHGSGQGLRLWRGTADDRPPDVHADLVISVNVIEHTHDPIAFLRSLRNAMTPEGNLILVCPNGGRPGLDLLFVDHFFSFAPSHLQTLLWDSGLEAVAADAASPALGEFQMVVARCRNPNSRRPMPPTASIEGRRAYLEQWQKLDSRLQNRVRAPAVCFGAGEAAGLLRAYAPNSWRSVRACAVDDDFDGMFGELPLVSLETVSRDETILVGVRPSDQHHVAERLRARFTRVVTWYDLVDVEEGA